MHVSNKTAEAVDKKFDFVGKNRRTKIVSTILLLAITLIKGRSENIRS